MDVLMSDAATSRSRSPKLIVAAATIGNALEFFDFTVYGFFAAAIGQAFFPSMSAYGQLLASLSTFGVGYIMRPVGGVVIGAYADRVGRRAAVSLTILLMGLGCAIIGCAPTYAAVGPLAPTLLVAARLMQGFSTGGEVGAATTLLVEQADARNRGLFGSWQFASQGLGIALGATISALLAAALTDGELKQWGWRVPFLLGVAITPIGFFIRRLLDAADTPRERSRAPFGALLRRYWTSAFWGTLLIVGLTVIANVVTFYLPTYAIRELGVGAPVSLLAAAVSGLTICAFSLLGGLLSDRFGRKRIILLSRIALCILIYPLFVWVTAEPGATSLLVSEGVLSAFIAIQGAPSITLLPEMFPASIRATGVAIVYSVGVAIFGGFAQTTVVWLVHETGDKLSPAYYMIACVFVSCLSLPFIAERAGRQMDG